MAQQDKQPYKPAGDTTATPAAIRVPRRLLLSSLQLAQLLSVALGDLRLSLELRRLCRVLSVAAVPLVDTLLRHHQTAQAEQQTGVLKNLCLSSFPQGKCLEHA